MGDWLNGWSPGDLVTAAELKKGWGCFYDHTTLTTDASLAITVPTWGADLKFIMQLTSNGTAAQAYLRINGDTSAIYDTQVLAGIAASAIAAEFTAQNHALLTPFGIVAGAPSAGFGELTIPNYRGTSFYTQGTYSGGYSISGGGASSMREDRRMFHWRNAAAVTTVTIYADAGAFGTGSRVRGYVSG